VIHLVSRVTGLHEKASTMQVVADTFPAGTLEHQNIAMQLIEEYEKQIVIFMEVP
jgi:anthranilate synthase component 1